MSNVPTNLIPTRITSLPEYDGSSRLGYTPYVINGRTYKVQLSAIALDLSDATPRSVGVASAGSGLAASRDDHVHPAVDLTDTTETQGVLPLGRGGTGDALSPVVGAVIYAAADKLSQTTAGNAGELLTSAGVGSAPYWQAAGFTAGTGISISGTFPSLTITNSAPDQTVSLTGAGTVSVTGTYPSFTITGSGGGNTLEASVTKPVIANFTLENSGGVATIADGPYGIVLDSVGTSGGIRFVRTNSTVGATWTMTIRSASHTALNGTGYCRAMIARNSTSGRILIAGLYNNSNQYVIQRWSSYTAFAANALAPIDVTAAAWYWWRMVNDGTNITYQSSGDGYTWSTFLVEPLATYINAAGGSVDQVGFGMFVGDTIMLDTCQSFTLV